MRDRSEFDDLAPLIKLIRAHPPFDRETELKVTRRARKGEKRAQEQLVVHNLSLVISVARKFMGRGVRLEDLVQEGNYGLLKAIEHFDPEKGNRFSTYAVWWIRAYITRCLKDGPSAVRRTMPNGGLPPRDISLDAQSENGTKPVFAPVDGFTPAHWVEQQERVELVRAAVLDLPPEFREAVVLCELEELSYEEAADLCGCPIGTIRSRLHRGRALLLAKLELLRGSLRRVGASANT